MAERAHCNAQVCNRVRDQMSRVGKEKEMTDDTLTFCDHSFSFSVLKLF